MKIKPHPLCLALKRFSKHTFFTDKKKLPFNIEKRVKTSIIGYAYKKREATCHINGWVHQMFIFN